MKEFVSTDGGIEGFRTPQLGEKQITKLDREIWKPGQFSSEHSVLDLGCGVGRHLAYFQSKGIKLMVGVEISERAVKAAPIDVKNFIKCMDIFDFLDVNDEFFDRIICLDILEHFSKKQALSILIRLRGCLKPDGAVIIKLPNGASPWGLQFQHGDLTHVTAFSPQSFEHLAVSAGFRLERSWGEKLGSPMKQIRSEIFYAFLRWVIAYPPQIWNGNFFAMLRHATSDNQIAR